MEVNQEGTSESLSIDGAVAQLRAAEEAVKPDEQATPHDEVVDETESTEEVEPEEADEVEAGEAENEGESEGEPEDDGKESENDDEELNEFQSLDELKEAAGLTQEQLDNLKVTRKVNGVDEEVTLAELRAGNQRDEDYRQKTMKLSEDRKVLDAERETVTQVQMQKIDQADQLIQHLSTQVVGDYNATDWEKLRVDDPAEFSARQLDFQNRQQQLTNAMQVIGQQKQQVLAETEQEEALALDAYVKEEQGLLLSKIPEWADEGVRREGFSDVAKYLKDSSFSDEEVGNVIDHRHIVIVRKAMEYDRLQSTAGPKIKKLKNNPKMLKPGAKTNTKKAKSSKVDQLRKQAKTTGSLQAAVALLREST